VKGRALLHVCCGPCAIEPVSALSGRWDLTAYYYNPNIHPLREYARRMATAKTFLQSEGVRFLSAPYDPDQYSNAIGEDTARPGRCARCYSLRLSAAACAAQELGVEAFTTTLLVSPYQDREQILEAGREASGRAGVEFLEEDFRPGYRAARQTARERGMYRQKYCGCRYSEEEAPSSTST